MTRSHGRAPHDMRTITFTRDVNKYAEGSVLVGFGDTRVLCTVSVSPGLPPFLKAGSQGWLTAEYSMLPRATHTRSAREASRGKQNGRTLEIQRLIGRSLRTVVDLKQLVDLTVTIDCDVLQADGGTRTASITGACVALFDAMKKIHAQGLVKRNPFLEWVAAVSVGVHQGGSRRFGLY